MCELWEVNPQLTNHSSLSYSDGLNELSPKYCGEPHDGVKDFNEYNTIQVAEILCHFSGQHYRELKQYNRTLLKNSIMDFVANGSKPKRIAFTSQKLDVEEHIDIANLFIYMQLFLDKIYNKS